VREPAAARPIVDDTRFDRERVDAIGDAAQVETAAAAEEAPEALRRASFDLILTDLHLPGLSGIDSGACAPNTPARTSS
jgi:CheY-like chemotaxis protein